MLNPAIAGLKKQQLLRPFGRAPQAQTLSYSFAHACYYFARLAAQKREWQRVVDAVAPLFRMTENALAPDVPAVLHVYAGRLHAFALLRYLNAIPHTLLLFAVPAGRGTGRGGGRTPHLGSCGLKPVSLLSSFCTPLLLPGLGVSRLHDKSVQNWRSRTVSVEMFLHFYCVPKLPSVSRTQQAGFSDETIVLVLCH